MAETHDLESKLEEATQANNALKNYVDELHDEVDAYREQVLELSQSQDDVSEDVIGKALQSVPDGVESWIDELSTSRPGFDDHFAHQFTTRLQDLEVEGFLADLTNGAGVDWLKVGRSQNCTYTILSIIIGYHLQHDLFRLPEASRYGHIYPIELSTEHMRVLSQVQSRMLSKDTDSDIRASQWRREAVTALMTDSDGEEEFEDKLLDEFRGSLFFLTGISLSLEQNQSIRVKVFRRALHALRLIAGSSNEYVFLGTNNRPGQYHSSSSGWRARDIYTWGKQTRPLEKGGVLALLFPGLSRESETRGSGITIVHPTFLVGRMKSRTPSPRKPGAKTPTRESSSTRNSSSNTGRTVRPSLLASEAKERASDMKSTSGDLLDKFGSFVNHRPPKDRRSFFAERRKGKTQRISRVEDPSYSPKSAATFPASPKRHSRSLTSSLTSSLNRRRRGGKDLENEIAHGLEQVQADYGPQDDYLAPTVEDEGECAVSQSYSDDRNTWNFSPHLGQSRMRSRSFSYVLD